MRAIHQFHSGTGVGDAVTNSMLLIQEILRSFGFVSEIYAEYVAPELAGRISHYSTFRPHQDDVLLVHHSMGHDRTDWILQLPVTRFLVYHNITPAEFFPPDNPFHHYAKLGRKQLIEFRPAMRAAIADSPYNADELTDLGYDDVTVIPLLMDVDRLQAMEPDPKIFNGRGEQLTVLFVGRISPNKCQHDLLPVIDVLRQTAARPARLVLVGGYEAEDPYVLRLKQEIRSSGLREHVLLTGKVSDSVLVGWYCAADVFLCMSEHEGFCVPLVEAMAFDLPVLAYKCTNIAHTLGQSGIMFTEKDPNVVAALVNILTSDRALRRQLVAAQRDRLKDFSPAELKKQLGSFFQRQGIGINVPDVVDWPQYRRPHYQIEGPLETSYSLALVNRQLGFALERIVPDRIGLYATEGPGDYIPDAAAIDSIPGLAKLCGRGRKASRAEVLIRNMFPPRVRDMDGQVNLFVSAWEESAFPGEWIDAFSLYLDGIACLSTFVKKILVDNGYAGPVSVIGTGASHFESIQTEPFSDDLGSGFRFLHVSSCFPRKGVDILLHAFVETFHSADQVVLVIKTFPNIHNTIEEQVAQLEANYPEGPRIVLINKDISAGQLKDLYQQCHAFVAPTRGEGFGLPMAEAMWYGLPVITTAYGGQRDFCTPETSWLVDYTFQPSGSHLDLVDSVWVEPDRKHLGNLMRRVYSADPEEIEKKVRAAKKLLAEHYTWDHCAARLRQFEQHIRSLKPLSRKKIRLGWVSSWNTRCGIATYSRFLLETLPEDQFEVTIFASTAGTPLEPDSPEVIRCWESSQVSAAKLVEQIGSADLDVLVIHFSFAFFSVEDFGRLLGLARKRELVTLVIFHSTKDVEPPHIPTSLKPIRKMLPLADRLLVHSLDDLNRFREWGLADTTVLFPHGVQKRKVANPLSQKQSLGISSESRVIASYGFMLPHKGLEELVRAFALLAEEDPSLYLVMVNSLFPKDVSREIKIRCQQLIRHHGLERRVVLETDFLPDQQSMALLGAADLIVFPYQETAESASGAIRYGLAADRPVACTPLQIFSDVASVVHFLPGTSVEDIAQGIGALLADPKRLASKQEVQRRWLKAHEWGTVGRRLDGMIRGLVGEKSRKSS